MLPGRLRRSLSILSLFLAACAVPPGSRHDAVAARAAASPNHLSAGWRTQEIAGAAPGRGVVVLSREALDGPARLRLVVIPGSGCTGFAPFAERYFAGLPQARIDVLHKPFVDIFAGPSPTLCSEAFVHHDALSAWRDNARAALAGLDSRQADDLPTLLLGISEGAEIAPHLTGSLARLAGIVLFSASGLDPALAGRVHAEYHGHAAAWDRLHTLAATAAPDAWVAEGRSLRYWRDLFAWPVTAPLAATGLPLLRVRGEADAVLPPFAYTAGSVALQQLGAPLCDIVMAGADHGLQGPEGDGVQRAWAHIEGWMDAIESLQGRQPLDCRAIVLDFRPVPPGITTGIQKDP